MVVCWSVLCLLVSPVCSSEPTGPAFQGLGDLAGGEYFSEAYAISSDGSTVVGWNSSTAAAPGDRQAFRWKKDTGMVALPALPGGIMRCNAGAASRDGSVIAGEAATSTGPQAVIWRVRGQDAQIVSLGDLPGGSTIGLTRGVSEDGTIVVGTSESARGWEAFRWTAGDGLVPMGDLPGGAFNSVAGTVTDGGTVIFGTGNVAAGANAFRWTATNGMRTLGDLPGGGVFSEPYNATADGTVVVGRSQSAASGEGFESFRWTAASGMTALGDLPGGVFESWALDVTDDGQTVVGFGTTASGQEAMVWTPARGMRRLVDVLKEDHGIEMKGWKLTWVTAISADGAVIAGQGVNPDGKTEGWVFDKRVTTGNK